MIPLLLQSLSISLFAFGLAVIVVELRTKLDKSLGYIGAAIMFLSAFSAIDLWQLLDKTWIEIQHTLFCFFPPTMFLYLSTISTTKKDKHRYTPFIFATIIATCFLLGLFIDNKNGVGIPNIAYFVVFIPSLICIVVMILRLLFSAIITKTEPKIAMVHLSGIVILLICGVADIFQLATGSVFLKSIRSFTIFGVLCLGLLMAYIFTERLVRLIKERLLYIDKLQESYKELEQARNLSELGRSTAVINHEIKNFSFVITGYAEYLKKKANFTDHMAEICDRIVESAMKISSFSNEVLNFSKAKILTDKRPLSLQSLIQHCTKINFDGKESQFTIDGGDNEMVILGEWRKLEQVFMNLFKNAFEAEAKHIHVRFIPNEYVILVTIEDDGIGCTSEQFQKLFQAFFTSKPNGTGLGLPTTRAIIESHGGHISVLNKSNIQTEQHGLIFNVSFPTHSQQNEKAKDPIVLIKDKLEWLPDVLNTFRNVFTNPHIADKASDIRKSEFDPTEFIIIGTSASIAQIMDKKEGYRCYTLVNGSDQIIRIANSGPDIKHALFTEEFILSTLLPR